MVFVNTNTQSGTDVWTSVTPSVMAVNKRNTLNTKQPYTARYKAIQLNTTLYTGKQPGTTH
jgi:hypothetical protein